MVIRTSTGHTLNRIAASVHDEMRHWWQSPKTGLSIERNYGELMMLAVSELAESMEGDRKDLMDDHLPQYKMRDVELADTLIRLFDTIGGLGIDIGPVFEAKLKYNRERADHKDAHRLAPGGKKY